MPEDIYAKFIPAGRTRLVDRNKEWINRVETTGFTEVEEGIASTAPAAPPVAANPPTFESGDVVVVLRGGELVTINPSTVLINENTAVSVIGIVAVPVNPNLPPVLNLSATTFPEDVPLGGMLGNFTVTNGSGTYAYSLLDSANGLVGISGSLLIRGATPFDFETMAPFQIVVRADNGVDAPVDAPFVISISDVLEVTAPPVIALSANTVLENAAAGTVIGTLSTTGGTGTYTYSVGSSETRVAIDGTALEVGATIPDYELFPSFSVIITADNGAGSVVSQEFTINVTDVVDTPNFTSQPAATVLENPTLAHSLTTDVNCTFSIVGGADAAQFGITGSTLTWSGGGTRDFENPQDADANNIYVVIVRATAVTGGLTEDQTITITVVDVFELTLAGLIINSNVLASGAAAGTIVGSLGNVTTDSTLSIPTQTPSGTYFTLSGQNLIAGATATNYATEDQHSVTVRETNAAATNSPRDTVFTINIAEVGVPAFTSGTTANVDEGTAFSHTFTVDRAASFTKIGGADQALFTLTSAGVLTMAPKNATTPVDADANNTYVVTVRATSLGNGQTADQTLTVTVVDLGVDQSELAYMGDTLSYLGDSLTYGNI